MQGQTAPCQAGFGIGKYSYSSLVVVDSREKEYVNVQSSGLKPVIFISHVHEEAALAIALRQELSRMYLGAVDFFVSSDRESLRGGDDWLSKIKGALSNASIIIPVVSPRSIDRTWINFEAGAGWLHKRVVPLCHSGMRPAQLPQPLQSLFGFDLHDATDVED